MGENSGSYRRTFISTAGAAGAIAATTAWTAKSYANIVGANDRIRIGFIGAGGMGNGHLNAIKSVKD